MNRNCNNECIYKFKAQKVGRGKIIGINIIYCKVCDIYYEINSPFVKDTSICPCCSCRLRKKCRRGTDRSKMRDKFELLGMIKRY